LYVFSATITLGDNNNVASIVGMAIRAKKLSIRFIIKLKDVVAPDGRFNLNGAIQCEKYTYR